MAKRPTKVSGGITKPTVSTGPADPVRARIARKATGAGGGMSRNAGMLVDVMQPAAPYVSGYKMATYRSSYAYGLGDRTGAYDIPTYFVMMNEQNGGMLYWPVTLAEKYSWYRYWSRCIYLNDSHLGQILMSDGTLKSVKDVEIGDEVVTGSGTVRRVKDKFERRCVEDKAVDLKVWCLQNSLKTTHHHPYWILRKDQVRYGDNGRYRSDIEFKPGWVHAENVHSGDYVLMAPYKPEKFSGLSVEQAAFLGYYASEGSIAWGLRCVGTAGDEGDVKANGWKWHQEKVKVPVAVAFTIHKDEESTVGRKILELALSVFGVEGKIIRRRENHIEIMVSGRNVGEFCHLHVGSGSLEKQLSKDLLDATVEAKKAFLLAYAEGDGHQYHDNNNKGKILVVTASDSLASQVQMIAISAGVMCRIAKYERHNDKWSDKPIWHITIPSWSADGLVLGSSKWIESDSDGDKHCAFFINGYAAFRVKEVTFSEEDDTVYNIEVDAEGDEKSYICNGMVTHNTDAYIGRGLELLADLPMSKLTLNMPKMPDDKKELQTEIQEFFQYQVEVLNLFELCQNILWEMNMIGNCFKGDTSIVTSNGVVPISEIRAGDCVLDASGDFSTVTAISRRRVEERIVSLGIAKMSGIEFSPTDEHPVYLLRGDAEVMVKAGEVRRGDWIGVSGAGECKDVESVLWRVELEPHLRKFYGKGMDDIPGGTRCRYEVPTGTNVAAAELREALLSWMSSLKEPTVADCAEVSGILGIADNVRVRSMAYSLRKRGEITVERTSKGRHGGSSMRWHPLGQMPTGFGHVRNMEISLPVVADETIEVDEDFMYLLGYWLGDGWLWSAKNKFSKEFEGFDICVSDKYPELLKRVDGVARSVFGDGAVDNEPFVPDQGMRHVTVKDPMLAAWWNVQFGHDCTSKRIPGWVMTLPSEKAIWLLRGMIDSDGFVSEKESGCVAGMVGTNRELMLQLFHLALKCGIPVSFTRQESQDGILPNGKDCSAVCWLVSIGKRGYYEKLVEGCHKALKVEWSEKEEVNPAFKEKDGRFYYRVDEVERPFFSGYVYNFEVEGSHTYCANGVRTHNCYIFHEWDDKKKMWVRAVMLPPEEVYVFQYPFSENKRVEYRPLRLVGIIKGELASDVAMPMTSGTPSGECDRSDINRKIIENMPKEMVEMVNREGCIVMDSDPKTGSFVHHIARRRSPYMDLGASVLERVMVPMLQKEHYRYTQLSLASRNMTPKNVITAPGLMPEEVDELRTQVDLSYLDPEYSVITNYEINWQLIGMQERFLDFGREYEAIENQIFAALGVTRELLTGEGGYSATKITVEILNTMFLLTREVLKNYIEKQLFIPICEAKGWYEDKKNGVRKYWYPEIGFNRLTIRDNQEVFQSLYQLYQKGSLPVDVIYELFNLNSDEMHAKMKKDTFTMKDSTFNRLLEEVNTETGRALVHDTDIVERTAKYLGLKYTPEKQEGEGGAGGEAGMGGFGESFGKEPGQSDGQSSPSEPGDAEGGAEGGAPAESEKEDSKEGGGVEEDVAKAIAEELPPGASEEDIKEAVEEAAKDGDGG